MNTPATLTVSPALEKAVADTGLSVDGAKHILMAFAPHFAQFHELRESAKDIPISAPKAARALRLKLKEIRVDAERTRVELKADSLRRGKAIDGVNAVLVCDLVPIEEAMEKIEKAEEIAEANRKAALKEARSKELEPFADPSFYDLGSMPAVQWDLLLAGAKAAKEAQALAIQKANDERVAREKAEALAAEKRQADEAAERERMRVENDRLAKVAADERLAREEIEAKAKAEREKAAKAAKVEREKREAAEAELKAKDKAEKEKADAEKAAAAKAASAPDRQKLTALASSIRLIPVPHMASESGRALQGKISDQIAKFAAWLESEAGRL